VAVAGDGILIAATMGDASGTPPDALWAYSMDKSAAAKILDGDGSFVLASAVADAATQRLFVVDASATAPLVRVFDLSQPTHITEVSSFNPNPKSGLPPQQIAWY
jgi:hypothetical protein